MLVYRPYTGLTPASAAEASPSGTLTTALINAASASFRSTRALDLRSFFGLGGIARRVSRAPLPVRAGREHGLPPSRCTRSAERAGRASPPSAAPPASWLSMNHGARGTPSGAVPRSPDTGSRPYVERRAERFRLTGHRGWEAPAGRRRVARPA